MSLNAPVGVALKLAFIELIENLFYIVLVVRIFSQCFFRVVANKHVAHIKNDIFNHPRPP